MRKTASSRKLAVFRLNELGNGYNASRYQFYTLNNKGPNHINKL